MGQCSITSHMMHDLPACRLLACVSQLHVVQHLQPQHARACIVHQPLDSSQTMLLQVQAEQAWRGQVVAAAPAWAVPSQHGPLEAGRPAASLRLECKGTRQIQGPQHALAAAQQSPQQRGDYTLCNLPGSPPCGPLRRRAAFEQVQHLHCSDQWSAQSARTVTGSPRKPLR